MGDPTPSYNAHPYTHMRSYGVPTLYSLTLLTGLAMTACLHAADPAPSTQPSHLTVHNKICHELNPRLFGQFFERPCGGERGPEGVVDMATGQLPPAVVELLKNMQIPIVRFPGGTDIEYTDWRDMISNVPGRAPTTAPAGRPLSTGKNPRFPTSNRFGFDECFALQRQTHWDTILVVNLRQAFSRQTPLADAAQLAAGLVAYTNAAVGAKLPAGMPDWPAVRAQNGHPEPYNVHYFQLGNEAWLMVPPLLEDLGLKDKPDQTAAWLTNCYLEYARQLRAVDPGIELIMDGNMGGDLHEKILRDPRIAALKPIITRHCYGPGPMDKIWGGPTTDNAELTSQDWWNLWTAVPGTFDEQGQCVGPAEDLQLARMLHYRTACTEWNWAGFGFERLEKKPDLCVQFAAGLGTASFIHGLMRNGDSLVLATQSMLLGTAWPFASIHADATEKMAPYNSVQGLATTFYNLHHGKQLLDTSLANIRTHAQPFHVGWGPPPAKAVASLDLLATADDQCIYIHAINRDLSQDIPLVVSLDGFAAPAHPQPIVHRYLTGRTEGHPSAEELRDVARIETRKLPYPPTTTFTVTLPAHSASIFEIQR